MSGSLKADFFDFDDFNGSQAYGSFTLPPGFEGTSSREQFDISEILRDNNWMNGDTHICTRLIEPLKTLD